MKKNIFVLLFLVVFSGSALAKLQKVKIIRIYDNNWFETQNGLVLRLANVSLPSLGDSDSLHHWVAQKIQEYARTHLLGAECLIDVDSSFLKVGAPLQVHLFKKFPLQKMNVNKFFLEKGYGWYVPVAKAPYDKEYAAAERRAKRWKLGIWRTDFVPLITSRTSYDFVYERGNYNIFPGVTDYRSFSYHTATESKINFFDLTVGLVQNAYKGSSLEQDQPSDFYVEYVRYFRTGYLQVILGKKWDRFMFALGGLGYLTGTGKYYSHDVWFAFSPIFRFQYRWQKNYVVQAALNDRYSLVYKNFPIFLTVKREFSHILSSVQLTAVKERKKLGLLAGCTIRWNAMAFKAQVGYQPSSEKWITRFQIGFFKTGAY